MKDNDALDWVNDNEVTVFIKSVRNNASKGRVGLNEVLLSGSWHFACPKVSITGW